MRRVHIVLEGIKDVYFLHELLVCRFGFVSKKDCLDSGKSPSKPPLAMAHTEKALEVCLFWADGIGKVVKMGANLRRPATLMDADTFVAALIVDADCQDPPGTPADKRTYGGVAERPKWLIKQLQEKCPDSLTILREQIFLLPDNQREGDLETLMRESINCVDTNHEIFFTDCWAEFDASLKAHHFNPATRKSMMNEYAAAFDAHTWDHNGINRAFFNDSLWDWHASALAPLVAFLNDLFFGAADGTA